MLPLTFTIHYVTANITKLFQTSRHAWLPCESIAATPTDSALPWFVSTSWVYWRVKAWLLCIGRIAMFWFGIPHFYHDESGFVQNYFVYVLFTFCSPYVSNSPFVHLLFTPNRTEREQNVNLIFYDIGPTKRRLGLLRGLPALPSPYWLFIPFWPMRMRPILYIIGDKLGQI